MLTSELRAFAAHTGLAVVIGYLEPLICSADSPANMASLLGWFSLVCVAFLLLACVVPLACGGWISLLAGVPYWLMIEDLSAHLFLGGYAVNDWSHIGFLPIAYVPNWFWIVILWIVAVSYLVTKRRRAL